MRLLDRYLLRNFFLPFAYCTLGFIAVWFVFELGNHVNEFINSGAKPVEILKFYLGQLPAVALLFLPMALLLALLYSLGRMSQSNELLAMLSAGQSLERILLPVILLGLLVTGLSTALSYAPAPRAEAQRELTEAQLQNDVGKIEKKTVTFGYLFRNRTDDRLWYIEKMPADERKPLEGVQIVQQDAHDNIVEELYAKTAVFDKHAHRWTFADTRVVHFDAAGIKTAESHPATQIITNWSETPYRLASALLESDKLSVPELHKYLRFNADFAAQQLAPFRTYLDYRWALPWRCLVVVLLAAPLGIVYQRRSVLTGVATAILMFLFIMFFDAMFVAMGKGNRLPAGTAAWLTGAVFAVAGLVLLRQKALNMDQLPTSWARLRQFVLAR